MVMTVLCSAQNQTNNWYFGNKAGINFGNGEVTVLENGSMQTPAGCATISDKQGNLMLYTNGQTIWNKNHQVMENGDGLSGEISLIQSAIIIPKPNDPSTYYVFYVRQAVQTSPVYFLGGVYYSEVKFDAQHPLGFVTSNKDMRIAEVASTGRLASIYHPETNTVRIITITKDDPIFGVIIPEDEYIFRIFNVTDNGINIVPLKIPIEQGIDKVGAMKISPDGKFLAFADSSKQRVYFYNYDNTAVTFSSYFHLQTIPAFGVILDPYGIEFSQDSNMFYYTGGNYVVQFPFKAINDPIPYEYHLIPISNPGSIQLARNGKIYIAQGNSDNPVGHLAIIHNPERLGSDCNAQSAGIEFETSSSTRGLPLFIASELRNRIIPSENDCVDKPFTFELDAYANIQSVVWDFGDGGTSTDFNPSYTFINAGINKVKATIVINNESIDLYKDIEAYPLPFLPPNQILSQCDTDNDGESVFNLENIKEFIVDGSTFEYKFYKTNDDLNNSTNEITNQQFYINTTNPEQIFVRMETPYGCISTANFTIENYVPSNQPIRDFIVCEDSDEIVGNNEGSFNLRDIEIEIRNDFGLTPDFNISFYGNLLDAQTKINTLDRYYVGISTIIWVRIEDENFNCFGVIPFNAIVNSAITLNIDSKYIICDPTMQPSIILDGGVNNDSWTWKNQSGTIVSQQQFFPLTQAGNYSVTVEKQESGIICSLSKNFSVTAVTVPEFVSVNTNDGQITITVKGNSDYEFSLDGINYFGLGKIYTFADIAAGPHTIFVKDINNCEKIITTEVYLLVIPKYFTPNNDTYNDTWKISGLSYQFYAKAEILIFDRYAKLLYKMNMVGNETGWSGINNNNQPLPATDYWYKVTLTNHDNSLIVKKGHFSLLR